MTAVPYTQVRQNFKAFMQKVWDDNAPITITRQGGKAVVMISEDEYNGMKETLYLMSSPENARQLLEAKAQTAAGVYESHDLIED